MNTDWEEKNIRKLIHELGRKDACFTPSFFKTWDAASSRSRKRRQSWRHARVAAMLLVIGGLAIVPLRFIRRSPTSTDGLNEILTLSQWQPPTDSLLKLPGEQLLRTVPSLGESSLEINGTSTDQAN